MNNYKFSKRSKSNMIGVNPKMIEIANLAIKLTLIDFGIPADGGVHTKGRQFVLYETGRSKANGTDDISYHQTGNALDFYAYVDNEASWDQKYLAMIAAAFLQAASILGYQLQWGGLWQSSDSEVYGWDMGHLQLLEED